MAESKDQQLCQVLVDLHSTLFDVTGVLLASGDGLALAQDLPSGVDSARVAAMAATALGLGKRIANTLGLGGYDESVVRANEGSLYLYMAGPAVLAVMAGAGANTGLINLEGRRAAKDLERILA
ncbi:MAG TPA: roadblock/LC7 domain-containing protein [Chloroflexia bacterium]|nr:roadblock/LC7 domain-containing protein [Chloroflexia bacterium]